MKRIWILVALCAAFGVGLFGARAQEPPAPTAEKVLWDYEDEEFRASYPERNVDLAVEGSEHAHGKRWMRISARGPGSWN